MHQTEIEHLLRQVQPVAPPSRLRARVIGARGNRQAWPWVVAASVLLSLTWALGSATTRLAAQRAATPDPTVQILEDLAERLGNDEAAYRMATRVLAEQQLRREVDDE